MAEEQEKGRWPGSSGNLSMVCGTQTTTLYQKKKEYVGDGRALCSNLFAASVLELRMEKAKRIYTSIPIAVARGIVWSFVSNGWRTLEMFCLTIKNLFFSEVISLSKLATKAFEGDKALVDKFNYTKNLKALTGAASSSTLAKKAKAAKALQTV